MNFFQKYGRKISYHMSGNMALYVQFIRQDVMMSDNTRTVTPLCTTYRILANILYLKLVPYAEEYSENTKEAFKDEDQLLITFLLCDPCKHKPSKPLG
jgi:hypothetical protein